MNPITRLCAAAALALPLAASAEIYAYVGLPLTPTQETTVPASIGTGSVTALYDSGTKLLMYSIVYQLNPSSTATAAHFHGPALLGANAGVQIGLPTAPTGNAGKLTGVVTLTAAQETDLLAGKWYFNIHSTLAGGGEMRAQLIENSSTLVLPTFANGKLTLPVVLTPGLAGPTASYNAELAFQGDAAFTFRLSGATPLR
jgi:hypothetical protein